MKKANYIIFIDAICITALLITIGYNIKFKKSIKSVNNIPLENYLLIMSTNRDYISSYIVYNLSDNTKFKIFERKNEHYSDFAVDKTCSNLYYSILINGRYNIFKVNLRTNDETLIFNKNYYGGDILDLCDKTLIFRAVSNDRYRYVLGKYSFTTGKIEKLEDFNNDFDMFSFYIDKNKKIIYTIEYSLTESKNINFPKIPTYNIFKYNLNNKQKKLIYSTNKIISSISVSADQNNILFEAETIENDIITKKIYLVDLKCKTENILLGNHTKFNYINIENINKPKFSSDNKGFYFLATTDESVIIEEIPGTTPIKSKSIYYYDLKSNAIKLIYNNKNEVINDYKVN